VKDVYDFLAEPLNLPTWTVAVDRIHHRRDNEWVAATARGDVSFRYEARNDHGVLDFSMQLPGEPEAHTLPVRVFANGDGTEMTFTCFQWPGVSDATFESDIEWTRSDLLALKALLETRAARP
jgi:hypothetical protein